MIGPAVKMRKPMIHGLMQIQPAVVSSENRRDFVGWVDCAENVAWAIAEPHPPFAVRDGGRTGPRDTPAATFARLRLETIDRLLTLVVRIIQCILSGFLAAKGRLHVSIEN